MRACACTSVCVRVHGPVVHSAGGQLCVEDGYDSRRGVSQDGVIDDVQKLNELQPQKKQHGMDTLIGLRCRPFRTRIG